MADLDVRPSLRQALVLALLCMLPLAALLYYVLFVVPEAPKALVLIALLPFFFPLRMYLGALSRRLTVEQGVLRLREGIVNRRETSMALERLEKVTVRRTLWQRLWGIGDLLLESAAESGAIAIYGIDNPHAVESRILQLARAARSRPA